MAVEFALLRLLREQPSHGYALRKGLSSLRHVFPVNNVNVYPLLRELEDRGHVTMAVRIVDSRMRRNYEITESGRRALEEWIESDHDPGLPAARDLASLKLLLASERAYQLRWLDSELNVAEAELERLQGPYASVREALAPLARLAAEEQVFLAERRVAFLHEAKRLFDETAAQPAIGAVSNEPASKAGSG